MTRLVAAPGDGLGRVEDGAVRFGDDWSGTFIRGDSSRGYAVRIGELLALGFEMPWWIKQDFEALRDVLNECYSDEERARESKG